MSGRVGACHRCGGGLGDADRFCARCGATRPSATPADPLIGRTVAGAYVIQELIGVGGMGRVYRAEQSMLGRTVAIKVVHPHLLGDEQSVARFYVEARTASRLNHPNSVAIIDFGRTDDGVLYLVMEHLRGRDLGRVMQDEGPLSFTRIVDVLGGVLAALGEAHSLGVVHRDLKPENILLQPGRKGGDAVKVVDFGLAKIVGASEESSITSPGLVCGTPDYMSPEQGRGEETDGRGDLYSVGVLLFELLADRLPYLDDTPTKVVLQHITAPVPDPRAVAPGRQIPAALATVCMRALAKSPEERFQTAEAFAEALHRALGSLQAPAPVAGADAWCAACGHANNVGSRFCAECGVHLEGGSSPREEAYRVGGSAPPEPRAGLLGRADETAALEALRARAAEGLVRVHVHGEAGVGKTRLLAWLAANALQDGDRVATGRPHASGAPVPYAALRGLVEQLLDTASERLQQLVGRDGSTFVDGLARAGLAELLAPAGLAGLEGQPRTAAVASMLAVAVRVAAGRARSGRVVLLADDVAAWDAPSVDALAMLPRFAGDGALLIVSASQEPASGALARGVVAMPLVGLGVLDATRFLRGGTVPPPGRAQAPAAEKRLLPLHLEQLRALGLTLPAADEPASPRLADAVLLRVERLTRAARRALQAAAVLGERAALAKVQAMLDATEQPGIDVLRGSGLVRLLGDELTFSSPFVRELVVTSIPAEARRRLHDRALEIEIDDEAPLEVRAEHAFRAGEPTRALLLLERMGDRALARGDAQTASFALRRGLDIARRELLETGDLALDRAIATFSRKFGDALDRAGESVGAEGVLREALDLVPRESEERARMLLVLGRVALRRERHRDALRVVGEALDVSLRFGELRLAGEAQALLGEVRRGLGDESDAADACRQACELLGRAGAPLARLAAAKVQFAEVQLDLGRLTEAEATLESAIQCASEADTPALGASATGMLGAVDELAGRPSQAAVRYRAAAALAVRAGDADARERWERASMERRASGVRASA
jgi:tetratricopeptide (TPR) repeat protein